MASSLEVKDQGILIEEVQAEELPSIINAKHLTPEEVNPEPIALVPLLKACAKHKDLHKGSRLHSTVIKRGLLENVFVSSAIVNMYAKCGALSKAQGVFDKLLARNVVLWTALIAGYAQNGFGKQALNCFEQMQQDGFSPSPVTFASALKACASIQASEKGEDIYSDIVSAGLLGKDIVLGTALVDMFAKCGLLGKAQYVFDQYSPRSVVFWNSLISGYVQHGHNNEALNCFERMQRDGYLPEAVTYCCILKACGSLGAGEKGQEIHVQISENEAFANDIVIGTALVDMYAKCGLLRQAQAVFDELPGRNVVLWTALLAGYAQHGYYEEAMKCFEEMTHGGFSPDVVTLSCILNVCGVIAAFHKGQEAHAMTVKDGLLHIEAVGIGLVDMYAKCGMFETAEKVFDELPAHSVVAWTVLISGFVQHGHGHKALNSFELMQHDGLTPDAMIFACALQACGIIGAAEKGQALHAKISAAGLLQGDLVIGSALVDMYVKCGLLEQAQEVFDKLPVQNVVLWTALIAGYTQHGCDEEALNSFEQMQDEGVSPDAVTLVCALKACGNVGALNKGKELHAQIIREGLLKSDAVSTALIDMLMKCGFLARARTVFDELPVRNLVLWTALIAAYAHQGQSEEALKVFDQMVCEGFFPDAVTFVCVLRAAGSLGALDKGTEIHTLITTNTLLETENLIANALVDMYGKCGLAQKAEEVFDNLLVRDVISWNALIAGYAQLGMSRSTFGLFDIMVGEGIVPNGVTFNILLNSCSHKGLLSLGLMLFGIMRSHYGIIPTQELHTCMIDLVGRAGHLDKAVALIHDMPFSADLTVWCSVLGACRKWENTEIARWAFEHAVQMDENHTGAYICFSNIFATSESVEEAYLHVV